MLINQKQTAEYYSLTEKNIQQNDIHLSLG